MAGFFVFLFLSFQLAVSVAPRRFKLERVLSTLKDDACDDWLKGDGQAFLTCISNGLSIPQRNITTNDCKLENPEMEAFCNSSCYKTIDKTYDFVISTGICSDLLNSFFGEPCTDDTICGSGSICLNGDCQVACIDDVDCAELDDPCTPNVTKCLQVNGTMSKICTQTGISKQAGKRQTLPDVSYFWKNLCAQSASGDYCTTFITPSAANWEALTCADVAGWGCCAGTSFQYFEYCFHVTINNPTLMTCNNSHDTCSPLPLASEYCAVVSTTSTPAPASTSKATATPTPTSTPTITSTPTTTSPLGGGNQGFGKSPLSFLITFGLVVASMWAM